jgi:prepilin-type N-terminal cleavage/methylation domain-containing protein
MKKGFTIIEIVVVVGIMLILLAIAFTSVRMANDSMSAKTHEEIYTAIMSAARRARYGVNNCDWGVYFVYNPITKQASQYIIYCGENYAGRQQDEDITTNIDDSILFSNISLNNVLPYIGDGNEITFEYLTGSPHQIGSIELSTQAGISTITIDDFGFTSIDYVQ